MPGPGTQGAACGCASIKHLACHMLPLNQYAMINSDPLKMLVTRPVHSACTYTGAASAVANMRAQPAQDGAMLALEYWSHMLPAQPASGPHRQAGAHSMHGPGLHVAYGHTAYKPGTTCMHTHSSTHTAGAAALFWTARHSQARLLLPHNPLACSQQEASTHSTHPSAQPHLHPHPLSDSATHLSCTSKRQARLTPLNSSSSTTMRGVPRQRSRLIVQPAEELARSRLDPIIVISWPYHGQGRMLWPGPLTCARAPYHASPGSITSEEPRSGPR